MFCLIESDLRMMDGRSSNFQAQPGDGQAKELRDEEDEGGAHGMRRRPTDDAHGAMMEVARQLLADGVDDGEAGSGRQNARVIGRLRFVTVRVDDLGKRSRLDASQPSTNLEEVRVGQQASVARCARHQ